MNLLCTSRPLSQLSSSCALIVSVGTRRCRCLSSSLSSSSSSLSSSSSISKRRMDPLAKRPNQKCDPYGQGGKPLSLEQAQPLFATVHDDWKLELNHKGEEQEEEEEEEEVAPVAIVREFMHTDFLRAARLTAKIAAVAQIENHFPSIQLDRRIVQKQWQVYTRVKCQTLVLGGLSKHDFHLAMMIDVEIDRPENRELWFTSPKEIKE